MKRKAKKAAKLIAVELAIAMVEIQRRNPSDIVFTVCEEYGVFWQDVAWFVDSELAAITCRLQARKKRLLPPTDEGPAG